MLTIEGEILGSKRRLFDNFSFELPPGSDGDSGFTLRDLLDRIVREQVAAFDERQKNRQFIRVLTEREVAEGILKGKIQSGDSQIPYKEVDADAAVATAIEAFEDGIYFVVIDSEQQKELDAQLFLKPDSRITFIRLTLLAGG